MNKLEKFLRENNVWETFKRNYDSDHESNEGISFDEFILLNSNSNHALHHAFYWHLSTEGTCYWITICQKWRDYLKKEEEMSNEKEFEFKVGDRVIIEGVLKDNSNDKKYPLVLEIEGITFGTFTLDGKVFEEDEKPILKLIERPKPKLTFQFIKENLVPMKHLLVDEDGDKRLYLGFTKTGHLAVDSASFSPFNVSIWSEPYIQDWTYEEYEE
jgi:hypothetical protein